MRVAAGARFGLTAALVVAALARAPARADAPAWTLHWRAPADCPDERSVRATIEAWLERSLERADPSGMRVDATVQRDGRGFALDLRLATATGGARERLQSDRCDTLANVIALKIALAADSSAWFEPIESRQITTGAPRVGLRLAGSLSAGLLPGAAPGVGVTGILRLGSAALEAGVTYGFPSAATYRARPGIGADLDLLVGSARLCALPGIGTLELPVCGGVEIGVLHGVGFGVPIVYETSQLFVALVLNPGVRLPIVPGWYAWLGFDGLFVVDRPSFLVRNLATLWEPRRFGGRVQLGIELRFD